MTSRQTSLEAVDLSWRVDGTLIVDGVTCALRPGEVVGVIGPNGAGKSSLLRCLAGLRPATVGWVYLDGRDLRRMDRAEVAGVVAVLLQDHASELDPSVEEVVMLGRLRTKRPFDRETVADREAVLQALVRVDMVPFAHRRWRTLSGGERQRVHLARAFAQDTPMLLLDEPTNHLDLRFQVELLALVRSSGRTIVAALHDLNLASQFCDRLLVMAGGRVIASGPPVEVLTPTLIRSVYGVEVLAVPHADTGRPVIVPRIPESR